MRPNFDYSSIDLVIKSTAVDPQSGKEKNVYYYKRGNTTFYKVWIYLEGNDLPYVDYVTYFLHPTFPDPERRIDRTSANQNCTLITWTWGTFFCEL